MSYEQTDGVIKVVNCGCLWHEIGKKCQVFVSKLKHMQKFKVSAVIDKSGIKKDLTPQEIQNKKCPIYLRVYIDGMRTMKSTGYDVELKHWDKKNQKITLTTMTS